MYPTWYHDKVCHRHNGPEYHTYVYQAVVWVKGDNLYIVDALSCIDVLLDFLSRLSPPMHVPNPNPKPRVYAKIV